VQSHDHGEVVWHRKAPHKQNRHRPPRANGQYYNSLLWQDIIAEDVDRKDKLTSEFFSDRHLRVGKMNDRMNE
jgi:hypothetical protein